MLKQEIIEKITKYFKLTHFEAEKIYDDIFQSIINGVKTDNFTDVSNLGEFIVKYNENNNTGYKKSVEFLPSTNLEDELSESEGFQESEEEQPFVTHPSINVPDEIKPEMKEEIREEVKEEIKEEAKEEIKEEIKQFVKEEIKEEPKITYKAPEIVPPVINKEEEKHEILSVEEEIRRKREEIIHKLDPQHNEEYHRLLHVKEGINLNVPKPILISHPVNKIKEEIKEEIKPEIKEEIRSEIPAIKEEIKKAEIPEVKEEIKQVKEEIKQAKEEIRQAKEEITSQNIEPEVREKETVDELSTKSFSDYFTEIKEEQTVKKETYLPPVIPPIENVIPPVAVNLHKEIVGDTTPPVPPPPPVQVVPESKPVTKNGNGYTDDFEKKSSDNSYYIWYKDSEPNAVDTQTMSYEYELLYQATKEAEYKSKLRIYVTTFIMFFSIVLILLIFSPVIYKYFFTPQEEQLNEQTPPVEESTSTEQPNNRADVNKLENNNNTQSQENNTTTPPVTQNEQTTPPAQNEEQKTQTTQPEQKTSQPPPATEQKTEQPPATEKQSDPNITGVVKSNMGWIDEKNRVIYVQLENGKFTIQESAWDSNEKASKRLTTVAGFNIQGLAGNIFRVDLGAKGTWFRARFGEFSTIEEAKTKAEELRSKEKMRLQAFLLSIFMYT